MNSEVPLTDFFPTPAGKNIVRSLLEILSIAVDHQLVQASEWQSEEIREFWRTEFSGMRILNKGLINQGGS